MKRIVKLSCALVLLLGACSDTPETGGGGTGGGGNIDTGPVITSFVANPPSISPGGSSTLSWEVSGATSLRVRYGDGQNLEGVSAAVNSVSVSPLTTTEYTLEATNAQNETTSSETKVTVEDVSEQLTKLGFITLNNQTPPSGAAQTSASGVFLEFTEGEELPGTFFNNPFEGSLDTCNVGLSSPEEPGDASILPPFTPEGTPAYISAGAQITLTAGGSTYAALEKVDTTFGGDNVTFYSAAMLGAPPADLTATVPGNELEFPAFTTAPLPSVAPFTLTAPAGTDPVTPTTSFTWDAGGDPNAVVLISVSESDPEEGTVSVNCIAQDDGSFAFPEDTAASLAETFEGSLVSAGRQAFRTEIEGEAVLVLGNASVQTFTTPPVGAQRGFWASQFRED